MNYKVSVIIPIYNVEDYLEECIQSVINQTLSGIQIILVDDGSTDNSGSICEEYRNKDNVLIIHKPNGGLSSARNAGLKVAEGDYIFFLDSDDWLELDALERLYKLAIDYNVDFVRFRLKADDGSTISMGADSLLSTGLYVKDRIVNQLYSNLICTDKLELGVIISAWRSLYKKSFLIENSLTFEDLVRYSEDILFSTILVTKTNKFYYIDDKIFYHYRVNPNSISKSFRENRWSSYKVLFKKMRKYFYSQDSFNFDTQIGYLGFYLILNIVHECEKYDKSKLKVIKKDKEFREMLSAKISTTNLNIRDRAKLLLLKLTS